MLFPFSLFVSGNSLHEHPESQYSGSAVKEIASYGTGAPGFFFLAEHAHHHTDNSGELENSQKDSANPPSHIDTSCQKYKTFRLDN
jgi:hypothetical protein